MSEPGRRRSTSVKVVITGPYGAGKTTFVRTLSEVDVLTTERRVAVDEDGGSSTLSATIAMDFGRLTIDESLQLYLFGAPSHQRFDFMWEVFAEGMLGFVVLVDDSRPDCVDEARDQLQHASQQARSPFVVAVNKVPAGLHDQAVRRARHTLRLDDSVRVVAGDARDRGWAKATLLELFEAARDHVDRRALSPTGAAADRGPADA